MTRKPRFTSSKIILLSLTASLFSINAQAEVLGTSMGNIGKAVDNLLPLELQQTARLLGQELDTSVLDYVDVEVVFEAVHNQMHALIPPEPVLSPALQLAHGQIHSLGDTVAAIGLPLETGQAASRLFHGVGDTVLSTGGLLYDVPDEPNPLTPILGSATNGLAATTETLFLDGPSLTNRVSSRESASRHIVNSTRRNTQDQTHSVGRVGNVLYPGPGDTDSLVSLLAHGTNGITSATDTLLQGNPLLSAPSPNPASPANLNTGTTDGLLAPVTNVLAGLNGNGDTVNGGPLAPVTGLLGDWLGNPR